MFSIIMSQRLYNRTLGLRNVFESIDIANQMEIKLLNYHRKSFPLKIVNRQEYEQTKKSERLKLDSLLRQTKQKAGGSLEENLRIEALRATITTYLGVYDTMDAKGVSSEEIFDQISPVLDFITLKINEFILLKQDQAEVLRKKSYKEDKVLKMTIAFIIILVFTMAMILIVFINRFVYTPIIELCNALGEFNTSFYIKTPIITGSKEIMEIQAAFNDMGERLSKQRECQYRFLSAIAHDLKNPLSAIVLSSELLSKQYETSKPELKSILDVIHRQAKQLSRMVGDLLDVTGIEAGKLELQQENTNLISIVKNAVELYQFTSSIHQIKMSAPNDPIYSMVDSLRIEQVMNNLISNAIKYSPKGGDISIEVSQTENEAIISIADQGIGIKQEEQKQIFVPFRRTEETRNNIPGIGLGLSVAKGIIEAHHGKIELTSKVGEGTTFFIYLALFKEI